MKTKKCSGCGETFSRNPNYSNVQWVSQRYCSKPCSEEQKRRVRAAKLRCKECGGAGPFHSYTTSSGRISRHNRCIECRNTARRPKRRTDEQRKKQNEYCRRFRARVKDSEPHRITYSKAWGVRHPEEYLFQRMRAGFSKDGERRKLLLSFDEFLSEIGGKMPTHCPVLGIRLDIGAPQKSDCIPTVDRLDSSKPYQAGNVAVISWRANIIKNMGTADEHRKVAAWMVSKRRDL